MWMIVLRKHCICTAMEFMTLKCYNGIIIYKKNDKLQAVTDSQPEELYQHLIVFE